MTAENVSMGIEDGINACFARGEITRLDVSTYTDQEFFKVLESELKKLKNVMKNKKIVMWDNVFQYFEDINEVLSKKPLSWLPLPEIIFRLLDYIFLDLLPENVLRKLGMSVKIARISR